MSKRETLLDTLKLFAAFMAVGVPLWVALILGLSR